MAKFIELVKEIEYAFGLTEKRSRVLGNEVRRSGWITKGDRGLNAPNMKVSDARNMIIAAMYHGPVTQVDLGMIQLMSMKFQAGEIKLPNLAEFIDHLLDNDDLLSFAEGKLTLIRFPDKIEFRAILGPHLHAHYVKEFLIDCTGPYYRWEKSISIPLVSIQRISRLIKSA